MVQTGPMNSQQTEPASASGESTSRRTVLAAAGVVGAGAVLAACSSGGSSSSATPTASGTESDTVTDVPTNSSALVATGDVPVGGATFVDSEGLIVSQPSAGEFHAFEARCPHQGCMVTNFDNGQLVCPCHGSAFDGQNGDVLQGPATTGLPEVSVKVSGSNVVRA